MGKDELRLFRRNDEERVLGIFGNKVDSINIFGPGTLTRVYEKL